MSLDLALICGETRWEGVEDGRNADTEGKRREIMKEIGVFHLYTLMLKIPICPSLKLHDY